MLLKFANRVSGRLFLILSIFSLFIPKKRDLVLFGASLGKYFDGNSGALYKYFIKYHKGEFSCVWLTDSKEEHEDEIGSKEMIVYTSGLAGLFDYDYGETSLIRWRCMKRRNVKRRY